MIWNVLTVKIVVDIIVSIIGFIGAITLLIYWIKD